MASVLKGLHTSVWKGKKKSTISQIERKKDIKNEIFTRET